MTPYDDTNRTPSELLLYKLKRFERVRHRRVLLLASFATWAAIGFGFLALHYGSGAAITRTMSNARFGWRARPAERALPPAHARR
jgi:hypothetical protein